MKYLLIFFLIILSSCSSPGHKKLHELSSIGKCKDAIDLAKEEFSGKSLLLHLGEIAVECEKNSSKAIFYFEKAGSPSSYGEELLDAYIKVKKCKNAENYINKRYSGNFELYSLGRVSKECRGNTKKAISYWTVAARNNYKAAIKALINVGVTPPAPIVQPKITTNIYNKTYNKTNNSRSSNNSNKCIQDGGSRMCYNSQSQRYGQTGGGIITGGGLSGFSGLSGMSGLD